MSTDTTRAALAAALDEWRKAGGDEDDPESVARLMGSIFGDEPVHQPTAHYFDDVLLVRSKWRVSRDRGWSGPWEVWVAGRMGFLDTCPSRPVPDLLSALAALAAAGVPLRAETLTPGEQPYLCVGCGTIGPGNVPCLNCAPAPSTPATGEREGSPMLGPCPECGTGRGESCAPDCLLSYRGAPAPSAPAPGEALDTWQTGRAFVAPGEGEGTDEVRAGADVCPECIGTGEAYGGPCPACHGDGRLDSPPPVVRCVGAADCPDCAALRARVAELEAWRAGATGAATISYPVRTGPHTEAAYCAHRGAYHAGPEAYRQGADVVAAAVAARAALQPGDADDTTGETQ